jgi:hypothetical protein
MLGRKALMAFPQGDILRRLHEAARPFGVFFKIHRLSPQARDAPQPQTSTAALGVFIG